MSQPEVHYDYSDADTAEREAERLWNDSDPTVPGIINVPPEATPPPAADGVSVEIDTSTDPISGRPARRPGRRWRGLALAALLTAAVAGLCEWTLAQRGITQSAVPTPVITALPAIRAATTLPAGAARAAMVPRAAAPAELSVEASGLPSGDRRRGHPGEGRHRIRRPKEAAPAAALETMDFELAGRGQRGRLRPIDTDDPFAP